MSKVTESESALRLFYESNRDKFLAEAQEVAVVKFQHAPEASNAAGKGLGVEVKGNRRFSLRSKKVTSTVDQDVADAASIAPKKKKGGKGLPFVPPEVQAQVNDEGVSRHLAQTAFNKLSSKDKNVWFDKARKQHSENVDKYKRKMVEEASTTGGTAPKVPKDASSKGTTLKTSKKSKSAAKSQSKLKETTEQENEARSISYTDEKLKKNGKNLKIIANADDSNNSVNTTVNESAKELEADKLKDDITSQFMPKCSFMTQKMSDLISKKISGQQFLDEIYEFGNSLCESAEVMRQCPEFKTDKMIIPSASTSRSGTTEAKAPKDEKKKIAKIEENAEDGNKLQCKLCHENGTSKRFPTTDKLKRHVLSNIHLGLAVTCPWETCSTECNQLETMNTHITTHKKEENYDIDTLKKEAKDRFAECKQKPEISIPLQDCLKWAQEQLK